MIAPRLPAERPLPRRGRAPLRLGGVGLLGLSGLVALLGPSDADARAQDLAPVQEPAQEEPGEDWASLEILTDAESYVVGQVVELRLRVNLDVGFFTSQALPLFRRPMDLPVLIEAPWWDELPGTLALEAPNAPSTPDGPERPGAPDSPAVETRTLALGDEVLEARLVEQRMVDGRPFIVLELRRRVLPAYPGTLTIPAPALHFAFATDFRDDFVQGRVPVDRRAARVTGRPLALTVLPLPDAGRPPAFTGAVGRFTVQAEVQPTEVSVGEQLVLTLRVGGAGNLAAFDAPMLSAIEGFTPLGLLSDEPGPPRTIRYGLVAQAASVESLVPPSFAYFDPEDGAYRTLTIEPIPVQVRVTKAAATGNAPSAGSSGVTGGEETPFTESTPERDEPSRAWLLAASVVVLAALAWLTARAWRTASVSTEPVPGASAFDAFHEATRMADADPTQAFISYLAARLGCSQPEVTGPGLGERLVAAGASEALSERIASSVREMLAARYGGQPPDAGGEDVRALAEELENGLGR